MTNDELSQCLDSCGDAVYGFCLYLTGSRMKADDLYQDTFLTALEKADRISIDDNPGSYLMGISHTYKSLLCRRKVSERNSGYHEDTAGNREKKAVPSKKDSTENDGGCRI